MRTLIAACILALSISPAAAAQENSYLEIPLDGRFGDQITARGLEDALSTARCLGAKHIVFTINSPGGD